MNINATEQTSTFPVPINKLKGRLMDEIGKTWETIHGTFEVNKDSIKWIMRNVKTSMFCLLYTSPSPRDGLLSRMPSSA